jgi:plasmid stabilization system protein ParE
LAERTENAAAWFNGLVDAIEGLSELPTRWPVAPESRNFKETIRQLLYGTAPHIYRVLYVVRANIVFVLHVRHGARHTLRSDEVSFPLVTKAPRSG